MSPAPYTWSLDPEPGAGNPKMVNCESLQQARELAGKALAFGGQASTIFKYTGWCYVECERHALDGAG